MELLKEMRKSRNLTQKDIASVLGVTQNCYSMIEKGRRGLSVSNAKKLSAVYGVDWWIFFDEEDKADE